MTNDANIASIDAVTDSRQNQILALSQTDEAERAALSAAASAGVEMREVVSHADLQAVYALYADIWRPDPTNPPVTTEMLRALTKAGNYVVAAFDGHELLGACVGFFGAPAGAELHSHIAGVAAAARGRDIGFALKLHQRAWAMRRGISAVTWTYDPLVRRNAHFNLVKLAATPTEYLPNFYGGMHDGINGSDDSDRLLVTWHLRSPAVAAACAGIVAPPAKASASDVAALGISADAPVPGRLDGSTLTIAVPADIERLRATDPALALAWRPAVRTAMHGLMARGARVTGFDHDRGYVLTTIQNGHIA